MPKNVSSELSQADQKYIQTHKNMLLDMISDRISALPKAEKSEKTVLRFFGRIFSKGDALKL